MQHLSSMPVQIRRGKVYIRRRSKTIRHLDEPMQINSFLSHYACQEPCTIECDYYLRGSKHHCSITSADLAADIWKRSSRQSLSHDGTGQLKALVGLGCEEVFLKAAGGS
ncbi:unnamed protein product [Diplocarpon coronariae]